jgi:hypothetical protein
VTVLQRLAQDDRHPPKPVLTLRVGITGHRPKPERFPADAYDRVELQLRLVFQAIDSALSDLHAANAKFYSSEPCRVRLVSGMAQGADQMAVWVRPRGWAIDAVVAFGSSMAEDTDQVAVWTRPEGWAVDAILPFPHDSYRTDFEKSAADDTQNVEADFEAALGQAQTVLELPEIGDSTHRNQGYAQLGRFLIRQVDVLVAAWDGRPAEDIGGTADVIRQAVAAHVPVVWIPTGQGASPESTIPRMIEEIEEDGTPVAPAADCTKGSQLRDAISAVVSIPRNPTNSATGANSEGNGGPSISERLLSFLQEGWPHSRWPIVYDVYKRLAEYTLPRGRIPVKPLQERLTEWDQFLNDAPTTAVNLKNKLREILMPRYLWADQLAIDLANKYRSAYILVTAHPLGL